MITLNGIPLLLEDPDGVVRRWMERYYPDFGVFGDMPTALKSGRTGSISGNTAGVGLGLPNYPPAPPPRLNTLYWPTGATRWARGYFLADQASMHKIHDEAHGSSYLQPLTLKMSDEVEEHEELETSMWLLTPKPITAIPGKEQLWLLPLVDDRYWWQFKHAIISPADNLRLVTATTWADLFTARGDAVGAEIEIGTVSSDYLKPDLTEFSRCFDSAPQMMDAAAHSVGLRIIYQLDGTLEAIGAAESEGRVLGNQDIKGYSLVAGGGAIAPNTHVPESLILACPKFAAGKAYITGEMYDYTIDDPTSSSEKYKAKKPQETYRIIRTSALADFTTAGASTPANNTALNTLATKIATDYYDWLQFASDYDLTLAGLWNWEITGNDDYVEWTFGRQDAGDEYLAHTRIKSVPYDFGVDDMLHQDSSLVLIDGDVIRGKLDGSLSVGGSATVSVWYYNGSAEADTGNNVTGYDWLMKSGSTAIASGKKVTLHYDHLSHRWYVSSAECA